MRSGFLHSAFLASLMRTFRRRHTFFQLPKQMAQDQNRSGGQDQLRGELGIGQAVQREEPVEDVKRRNFQHNLAKDGEQESFPSHAGSLEDAHGQEIHGQKGQPQTKAPQKPAAVADDGFVLHKQPGQEAGSGKIEDADGKDKAQHDFYRKQQGIFHPLHIAGGIVVADQGHDALGKAHGNVHGDHIDFLGDAHGRHGVRAVDGSKVVQDRHSRHIEQILDGGGDAHPADAKDDGAPEAEHVGPDADEGGFSAHIKEDKEIQAGHAVGEEGGKPRPFSAHMKAPRQDENGIQDHIQDTAAHGPHAGMKGRAFRTDQIGQHYVEDGRGGSHEYRPFQIA